MGGIRGYKGGAVFEPRETAANFDNPDAIIIKEKKPRIDIETDPLKRLGILLGVED